MIQAATNRSTLSGMGQLGKIGLSTYLANVSAMMAFDVGLTMINAIHKNRKAGNGPNASRMYA